MRLPRSCASSGLGGGFGGSSAGGSCTCGGTLSCCTISAAPAPDAGLFVGVDFEAHNVRVMVLDFALRTVKRIHQAVRPTQRARGDPRDALPVGPARPEGRPPPLGGASASAFPARSTGARAPRRTSRSSPAGRTSRSSPASPRRSRCRSASRTTSARWPWRNSGSAMASASAISSASASAPASARALVQRRTGHGRTRRGPVGRWYLPARDTAGANRSPIGVGRLSRGDPAAGGRPGGKPGSLLPQFEASVRAGDRAVLRILHRATEAHACGGPPAPAALRKSAADHHHGPAHEPRVRRAGSAEGVAPDAPAIDRGARRRELHPGRLLRRVRRAALSVHEWRAGS